VVRLGTTTAPRWSCRPRTAWRSQGTTVTGGSLLGIVCSTGMGTEVGKIQAQIQSAGERGKGGGGGRGREGRGDSTPLSQKLDEFSDTLTKAIGAICIFLWVININDIVTFGSYSDTGAPGAVGAVSLGALGVFTAALSQVHVSIPQALYHFKEAVALAVAAIPEGLPAVITTCLALGTQRMARENAVVRHLPSVETLGCTTVICSDETGTLTTSQMAVAELVTVASPHALDIVTVTGASYDPSDGALQLPIQNTGPEKPDPDTENPDSTLGSSREGDIDATRGRIFVPAESCGCSPGSVPCAMTLTSHAALTRMGSCAPGRPQKPPSR